MTEIIGTFSMKIDAGLEKILLILSRFVTLRVWSAGIWTDEIILFMLIMIRVVQFIFMSYQDQA